MIITNIIGGLGNQMFQYAFHLYLKNNIKNEDKFFLDINQFDNYGLHNGYELERIFSINEKYISKSLSLHNIVRNNILQSDILKKVMIELSISKINIFIEDIYSLINLNNLNCKKEENYNYFIGYWQNYNYIKNNAEKIKNIFSFNLNKLDKNNKELLNNIENNNSVSIHIRRGDYLNKNNFDKFANICNEKYYLNAINYIEKNIENPKYFVFSDDIEYCKYLFKEINNIFYVQNNKGKDSYWDMFLMSKCKHNIIANSSFSWWGAFLNSNNNKIVLAPNKWFNFDDISQNILPKEWIKIES